MQIGVSAIEKCIDGSNLYDDDVNKLAGMAGQSKEEVVDTLIILWRGAQDSEERQRIEDLPNDMYLEYVDKLSSILKNNYTEVVDRNTLEQNIFYEMDVESKFKYYADPNAK